MIFDSIENAEFYYPSVKGLKETITAIKSYPKENYKTGRKEVTAERLFLLANEYDTKELGRQSLMEAHRTFIDVMYIVEGEEIIYVKPVNRLCNVVKEYDTSSEALLGSVDDDVTAVRIQKGEFIVLFPQDAHCPACRTPGNAHVKKIIGKLRVDY